ncbi:MAG: transcription-repair coupling factor, partial [Verrucomicrobiae bacterium]|nr:transcription-repair coupling factor [Verrucomicrobiae bacterium]
MPRAKQRKTTPASPHSGAGVSSESSGLLDRVANSPAFAARLATLDAGDQAVFDHVAEAAQPLVAALLVRRWLAERPGTTVWLACPHIKAQEILHAELSVWGVEATFLPENEWAGFEEILPDPEAAAERLAGLKRVWDARQAGKSQAVVLCAQSLDETAPRPGSLTARTLSLRAGDRLDLSDLSEKLAAAGFEKTSQVFQRGQFAVRGGIVDVFSWQALFPVRLELFDDEIESIREFDADDQTSTRKLTEAEILLAEADLEPAARVADYIGSADLTVDMDLDADAFPDAAVRVTAADGGGLEGVTEEEDYSVACYDNPLGSFEAGDFILQEQRRHEFSRQMAEWQRDGWTVAMAFHSRGEIDRFAELVSADHLESGFPRTLVGSLSRGFTIPGARVAVLSDAEIFGRYQHQRTQRRMRLARQRQTTQRQADLTEFNYGDLVVHVDYGIGKFRGIRERESDTRAGKHREEVLEIEYADEARLFVPLDQAHLVSRYIGTGKKAPRLSRLGDKRWSRLRKDAERSILDYAARLLTVQAERQTKRGHAHPPDNKWQWEF